MAAQVLVPYSSCFLTDLQASSALAEASAQRRLRNCRRCAAASSSVRLQLRSLSTSRSADRPLSSMRPDWKHMVASETQEGSQQSELPHARHHSSGRSKITRCSHALCSSVLIYLPPQGGFLLLHILSLLYNICSCTLTFHSEV